MFWRIKLLFLVISVGCNVDSSKYDHEPGFVDLEDSSRVRRSAGSDTPVGQLPTQNTAGSQYFMNPNMQPSYFLGQCVLCPPGDPGTRGAPGPQGRPGPDGRDQLILGDVVNYTYQAADTPPPASKYSAGVTYTRWGKTSCSNSSELVYRGVMASGNNYAHKGSGVDFLCLPLQPTFAATPAYGSGGAFMYAVEYETNLLTSRGIYQNEAPCVVCLAGNKETVLTIPGTNTCLGSQNWTLEYQGYMMSSIYTKFKSTFICVDEDAEAIPTTNYNNNEPLLYLVNAKCSAGGGGLPCPPYVDGHNILCAVCTL